MVAIITWLIREGIEQTQTGGVTVTQALRDVDRRAVSIPSDAP